MLARQTDIFIHVEGYDIFEGNAIHLVRGNERAVDGNGAASGGEAEDERLLGCGRKAVDAVDDVFGDIGGRCVGVVADDETHGGCG